MKKKVLLVVIIFLVCTAFIKVWDITNKYEVDLFEYFAYSKELSQNEKRFLENSVIHYGIDMDDAPFAFTEIESELNTGLLVDYFNQLSVTLENNFQPVPYESYHLAVKLKEGEIDAAVLNRTSVNEDVFQFTQTLYTERSKILVQGDSAFDSIHNVHHMSVAVIAGSTAHHAANEFFSNNETVQLVLTNDLEESFYLLGMGQVDAILGDEAKISYHLNQAIQSNFFKFLEGSIYEEEVAIAVNQDQTELFDILNKGILELKKNDQFSHIHSKWFGSFIPESQYITGGGVAANVLIIILALTALLFIWSQTVTNTVTIRTQELQESRQELRNILDSLMNGLIVTDGEGKIQVCNETARKLLGIPSENIIDKQLTAIPELEPFLIHVNEKDAFRQAQRYYLISHRRLDGISNKNLLVIEDYTARYQYESLTRQEAKMIAVGELSAGLAHEIRNPLGLIKSYSYLLRKKIKEKIDLHPLNVIDDSVDRINQLIENLLGFSRLSVEKSVRFDAEALILSLIALERKNLEKAGITISTDFNWERGPIMKTNEDVLKLTLVNLINNSIDALADSTKKEKKIEIKVQTAGDRLRIDFIDNGNGISKTNMEAVFNPFFTTKETGTGLGLYILDSEIRSIEGSISVESTEGEGASFHIVLPIEKDVEYES